MTTSRPTRLTDILIALTLSIIAAALLISAYSYSRASGIFPIFIGWIFLLLSVLELTLHASAMHRQKSTAESANVASSTVTMKRDINGFLWLSAVLGLLFAVGFLVATPLFVFTFLWRSAERGVFQSLTFAALATAFIYVVFVWLLKYHLYPGILLSGFAA